MHTVQLQILQLEGGEWGSGIPEDRWRRLPAESDTSGGAEMTHSSFLPEEPEPPRIGLWSGTAQ